MEFVWIIIGAMAMTSGGVEPVPVLAPSFSFSTEAKCEERLMWMLDDGYNVSRGFNGSLIASKQSNLVTESYRCASLIKPE